MKENEIILKTIDTLEKLPKMVETSFQDLLLNIGENSENYDSKSLFELYFMFETEREKKKIKIHHIFSWCLPYNGKFYKI